MIQLIPGSSCGHAFHAHLLLGADTLQAPKHTHLRASTHCCPRCVLHWDNVHKDRQLVLRPQGSHGQDWQWSGSFAIPDKEQYFGLRIHNRWALCYCAPGRNQHCEQCRDMVARHETCCTGLGPQGRYAACCMQAGQHSIQTCSLCSSVTNSESTTMLADG
jgi:hypothetical protein